MCAGIFRREGTAGVCTVTWLREKEGYRLLFNRDELKSRAEARPPEVRASGGARWIAPVDPDGGGTWLATSERGLTIGVLNGVRRAGDDARAWRSRGELAPALIDSADPAAAVGRLRSMDLTDFRPFRLLAIGPAEGAVVAEWDGVDLTVDPAAERRVPLVSSSFDETAVGAARRDEYARRVGPHPTADALRAYHRSTHGGPSAYTVAMERPEAATRSLTEVCVGPDEVRQRYHAGRPDRAAPPVEATLPRTAASREGAA